MRHDRTLERAPVRPRAVNLLAGPVQAITIREPGGPEVLSGPTVPDPEPAAGEVLVDVVASAVNRADLMQRQGHYPPPPGRPPYPGLECAGRISALGTG